MQIKHSKILDGYNLVIVYPDDREYSTLKTLFDTYGLAVTNTKSNIIYVDGGGFDENNFDNDHLDAIDAHEMSHIILGHGIKDPNPTEERDADYFAIQILNAMGYSDAARILIDEFPGRHGISFGESEDTISSEVNETILDFMSNHFPDGEIMNESYQITKDFFNILAEQKLEDSKKLLIEGRVEDAIKYANDNHLPAIVTDYVIKQSEQLSNNHKFLVWLLKMVVENDITEFEKIQENIILPLRYFIENSGKFTQKDINSYSTLADFVKAVNDVRNKERRSYEEQNEGDKLYENDKIQIFIPSTHKSSCYYGAGTRWCTTSPDPYRYDDYRSKGELYYVLDKTKPSTEDTYKLAIRFLYAKNELGFKIEEIRDAKNDRYIDSTEFMTYVGEDGYQAIINDFSKRHENELDSFSYQRFMSKYNENPESMLKSLSYKQLYEALINSNMIQNGVQLCELLLSHGINPLTKEDVNPRHYYNYLINHSGDITNGNAIKIFVDEYKEYRNVTNPMEPLSYDMFSLYDILKYFKHNNPEKWGIDLVIAIMNSASVVPPSKLSLGTYLNLGEPVFEFWEQWNGTAGLFDYLDKNSSGYSGRVFSGRGLELKLLIKSAMANGESILSVYNGLSQYLDGYTMFDIISGDDVVEGFKKMYGDDAVKEMVPLLIKNNVPIFDYLTYDILLQYYGTPDNTIKASIDYYTDENGDYDYKLFKFLSKNIKIDEQIKYFDHNKASEDEDGFVNFIGFYGDEFFSYYKIEDLLNVTDYDVEYIGKIFAGLDLESEYDDNVGQLRIYESYYNKLSDKEMDDNDKIEYKKKAFKVSNMNDVRLNEDGTVDLLCDGWYDFIDWFYDGSIGYSHSNPRYVAKNILGEDNDWEPYYDVVNNWTDQVWDNLNNKGIEIVKNHIKETIIPTNVEFNPESLDMDADNFETNEDSYVTLTPEILDSLSESDLGMLIKDYFDDLKSEMTWAYEGAYNNAAKDEWYEEYTDAIIDILKNDNPRWEKTGIVKTHRYKSNGEDKEYQNEEEILILPNIDFFNLVDRWVNENKDYEQEFQYNFIATVGNSLSESGEQLSPDPSEWPDSNKVAEYFNDDLSGRI